jgi:hypothetical protein
MVSKPKRIQRKRTKGWKMPEGAVYVGRPTRWGNPIDWRDYPSWSPEHLLDGELDDDPRHIPDAERRRWAVIDFDDALREPRTGRAFGYPAADVIRTELAGKDLACWCPLEDANGNRVPCHADVLLELANQGEER